MLEALAETDFANDSVPPRDCISWTGSTVQTVPATIHSVRNLVPFSIDRFSQSGARSRQDLEVDVDLDLDLGLVLVLKFE